VSSLSHMVMEKPLTHGDMARPLVRGSRELLYDWQLFFTHHSRKIVSTKSSDASPVENPSLCLCLVFCFVFLLFFIVVDFLPQAGKQGRRKGLISLDASESKGERFGSLLGRAFQGSGVKPRCSLGSVFCFSSVTVVHALNDLHRVLNSVVFSPLSCSVESAQNCCGWTL